MYRDNPFRIFFPIGLLFGIWAASVWVLFGLGLSPVYPGALHADLMVGGFLFLFSAGFLMTAIPRFTDTYSASALELWVGSGLALALALASVAQARGVFYAISALSIFGLAGFAVPRFRARRGNPPPSFVFIGIGIACGLAGAILLTVSAFTTVRPEAIGLGRALYFQGMILGLVLGVGGRLIPGLLGHGAPVTPQSGAPVARRSLLRGLTPMLWITALLFIASFPLEFCLSVPVGRAARALAAVIIGFGLWKLHRFPVRRGSQTAFIWISGWSIVLGLCLSVAIPAYTIHLMHLVYMGGMGLLTIMIATRVTLSHGKHDLSLENRSKILFATGFLIVLGVVTRVTAGWLPQVYVSHLAYAAICWVIALGLWGAFFVPKILRPNG